ncbi:hypothetical protein BKA56DRAFT_667841 [Ilyonectria sp. MPI-CAGE-AT-0026]|nr:hypothetical protein BKA56DRAFT_667841 [Ilyonectria sp. MPI-CAGE-AT-0026]
MPETHEPKFKIPMEVNEAPKTNADFSPVGEFGKSFPLGPKDVDPTNLGSRRTHMNAYFLYMFPETKEAILEKMRRESVESVCFVTHSKGVKAIGAAFFEFHVDQTLWVNFFAGVRDSGAETPQWPWAEHRPEVTDMEHGRSVVYDEWLKAKDTQESKSSDTENEATDATVSDDNNADTEVPGINVLDFLPRPGDMPELEDLGFLLMDNTDMDTTENSDSVQDGMALESFSLHYRPGVGGVLVEIADYLAGLSDSGEVEHQADALTSTLSGANIVPLGPRDGTRVRSVGTQTVETGNLLPVGPDSAVNDTDQVTPPRELFHISDTDSNNSGGVERQPNLVSHTTGIPGGIMGRIGDLSALIEVFEFVKNHSESREVGFQIFPINKSNFDGTQREEVDIVTVASNPQTGYLSVPVPDGSAL